MNPLDTQVELATGLAFVCVTCTKYSQAKERGLTSCLAVDGCASPIGGDTFHEYDGPITDFLRFCFVCGEKPSKGVVVKGHPRGIGVCTKHTELVSRLAPEQKTGKKLPILDRFLQSSDGSVLVTKPKEEKTLSALIARLDAEGEDSDV